MEKSTDAVLLDLPSWPGHGDREDGDEELNALVESVQRGEYRAVLESRVARTILAVGGGTGEAWLERIEGGLRKLLGDGGAGGGFAESRKRYLSAMMVGLAAFHAFLQANVTGPPLGFDGRAVVMGEGGTEEERTGVRKECLASLEVDGVSVYQLTPEVELFCLARAIFLSSPAMHPRLVSRWMRIRMNAFQQRLLTAAGKIQDVGLALQMSLEADFQALERDVLGESSEFTTDAKVQFLLERAQVYIMQGMDVEARKEVGRASAISGVKYVLSGALGKRTRFQESDISQLVVFAKSREVDVKSAASEGRETANGSAPVALDLNDDTLLESIDFSKSKDGAEVQGLPAELEGISPDSQPQLHPLDQIILLTEATIKDKFSPLDKLNREEILPFATRVLADTPTNYQIYTQALLVRSRIEAHRSRTQERSVLQLQAIVDQIIADTEGNEARDVRGEGGAIPEIKITSFLPKAKADESALVTERIQYIHQLHTPTRWEVESELAYAWSNAGSLVSALEIFKRLQLWPEVALCYFSVSQEDKARQIIRRQLFYSARGPDVDKASVDAPEVISEKWEGEIRSPPPPHAPRMWCILGDLDQDPICWNRAWDISNKRFARAQRTLGEYYTKKGDLGNAREAYIKATVVNRQNNETWSRLGDIDLKVGNWDGAIIAFQQSIMIDDTDAKTYSNLGSALLSKHAEMVQLAKVKHEVGKSTEDGVDEDDDLDSSSPEKKTEGEKTPNPKDILRQALIAYKKGASLAHDNWQIWDNVITIAGRMSPPSYPDILQAMSAIIRIRSPSVGEAAIDADILRALVGEVIAHDRRPITNTTSTSNAESTIYLPPRGTLPRAVIDMIDRDITPLITTRSELYSLIEKIAIYRKDYAGALGCAEKAWRISMAGEKWLEDKEMWREVVSATDALVSAFENYGPMEVGSEGEVVEKGWRGKARSAVRGVLGKARGIWEGTEEWELLEGRLVELKGL